MVQLLLIRTMAKTLKQYAVKFVMEMKEYIIRVRESSTVGKVGMVNLITTVRWKRIGWLAHARTMLYGWLPTDIVYAETAKGRREGGR